VVRIDASVVRSTATVVLHARDLDISQVTLAREGAALPARVVPDEEAQTIALETSDLAPGPLSIEARFGGVIRSDLKGVYRSTRGAQRFAVAVVFPSEARRVFPCFDEPAFKARFALELTAPADGAAIANARSLEKRAIAGGRALWRFAETPPLSTYLVMFAVGPFEATDAVITDSGQPVRVWLPAGLARDGIYARDAHRAAVEWLERYTGIAYPYDKVEGVGLADFPAGAMENPGAITYRLDLLAIDPARTAASRMKDCVSVVSHELTHMWWGDLATLAWWDDIWLNESFATFVGHKAEHAVHPDWDVWREFAAGSARGFALDGLASTHAIHSDVATAEEALQRFDAVSYEKGATVLRMIESFLGEDVFREGVRLYLERYREKNATARDFWRALDDASGEDVTAIAMTWITEPGHPIVELRLESETRVELRQRRFFLDRGAPTTTQRWPVPLTIRTASRQIRVLLDGERGGTEIARGDWVHPNAGATGFYRFALDTPLRERLLAHVASLEPTERLALVENDWALTFAGAESLGNYFALLDSLRGEGDRVVLRAVAQHLRWLATHVPPSEATVAAHARALFSGQLTRLGWDLVPGESEDDRELRATAIAALGSLAHDDRVRAEAASRVRAHLAGRPQPPDVVGASLRVAALDGDAALARTLLGRLNDASTDPQEQRRILDALPCFRERAASDAAIAAVFDGTVRDQDLPGIFFEAFRNAAARGAFWRAFHDRYQDRVAHLEAFIRGGCVMSTAQLTAAPIASEVEAFLARLDDPDMGEIVARTREMLRLGGTAAAAMSAELHPAPR
jgi:puromycin-sensitive aminopeptidase